MQRDGFFFELSALFPLFAQGPFESSDRAAGGLSGQTRNRALTDLPGVQETRFGLLANGGFDHVDNN